MQRFIILSVCLALVWGSPFHKSSKIPLKNVSSRIINGDRAELGQIPWQAALRVSGIIGSWFCGGSIISNEWILTAGHCVDGARSAVVLTGLVDLNNDQEGDVSESTEFVLHELYDTDTLDADIGLLRLERPIAFGNNTEAIRLAEEPLDEDVDVTVSGWGLTSDGGISVSRYLNFVNLRSLSNAECQESYEGEDLVLDGMVCAVSRADDLKSPCSGDSGGPLVAQEGGEPIHVAVVSFVSDRGCESGVPSGYTRTAFYRDWIREHTRI